MGLGTCGRSSKGQVLGRLPPRLGLGEVRRNHKGQLDGVLCSRLDRKKARKRKVNYDQEQER